MAQDSRCEERARAFKSQRLTDGTRRQTRGAGRARTGELERQVGGDSGNSSRPPSSDGMDKPSAKPDTRKPGDRKPGAVPVP